MSSGYLQDVVAAGELTVLSINSVAQANVISADWTGEKREKIPLNVLGQSVKQFRKGNATDPGELTITILYDPTSAASLLTWVSNDTEQAVTIDFYNGETKIDTLSWQRAVALSFKINGIKDDSNVEAEVVIGFNDLAA